jgi:leucyl-tRNA synthetase
MYQAKIIEAKWQKIWSQAKPKTRGEKFYLLEMFPYPSGKIHMGHVRNYSLGDALARFKSLQGYQVLHPMGWDAFGLPAENAARQESVNPSDWTEKNIAEMRTEIKLCGFSYDWSREIKTCSPDYYQHEQEFFIKLYEAGLIYQKESLVNWDPLDKTVLANEQVINGRGWRSGALVEKKSMKQWFCKITAFAEELLEGLKGLDSWPDSIKTMQENWIGKSEGAIIHFELENGEIIEVYSTRPETIYGCSFLALAYDHPLVAKLEKTPELDIFIKSCQANALSEALIETKEKEGYFTGLFAQNPLDPLKKIPVYLANFVLSSYGTGAIFGCPDQDDRDRDFAKKYSLPELVVIEMDLMVNSDFLNGKNPKEAKEIMIKHLEEKNLGQAKVNYRLRDWGISRQKYWGCPIPMIYCKKCGTSPAKNLPVILPPDPDFSLGGNPLESHPTWKKVPCPLCQKEAERETDTLDTFFESSWYFAKFCAENHDLAIDREACEKWLPVDYYIGGAEHAVMHLLYARFFTRALKKLGYWTLDEPFKGLFNQGMLCNKAYKDSNGLWVEFNQVEEKNGKYYRGSEEIFLVGSEKMSKSKKNGVVPLDYLEKYGADSVRLFLLSDSPPEKDLDWNDSAIQGCFRYLNRLYRISEEINKTSGSYDKNLDITLHKTIKSVTECYQNFGFNSAIAKIRELNNQFNDLLAKGLDKNQAKEVFMTILILLNPLVPHITSELWSNLSDLEIFWPNFDPNKVLDEKITLVVQVQGKLRGTIQVNKDAGKEEVLALSLNLPKIHEILEGQKPKEIIFIPNKIINLLR